MDRPLGERAARWPSALRKKRRRGGRTPKPGGSKNTRDDRDSVLVRVLPLSFSPFPPVAQVGRRTQGYGNHLSRHHTANDVPIGIRFKSGGCRVLGIGEIRRKWTSSRTAIRVCGLFRGPFPVWRLPPRDGVRRELEDDDRVGESHRVRHPHRAGAFRLVRGDVAFFSLPRLVEPGVIARYELRGIEGRG